MMSWRPDSRYVFPTHNEGDKSRAFQYQWLNKYSWLVYSEEKSGGFCLPCVLFAKHSCNLGQLVKRPLSVFTSASNRLRDHEKKVYHKNALIDAESFLRVYNQNQSTVSICSSEPNSEKSKNSSITD